MRSKELAITNELPQSDIVVYGTGPVGDKASQLIEKTPLLRSLGFATPPRLVLAEGFFSDFFQRNNLGKSLSETIPAFDTEKRILRGQFSHDHYQFFQSLLSRFGTQPLMLRSSAVGDARGTGVYHSELGGTSFHQFKNALRSVLASYFSPDAQAYRRDAKLVPGFGVIVEPLIAQTVQDTRDPEWTAVAPLLSGTAYTSDKHKEAYIRAVPGFGAGVTTRDTEKITLSLIQPYDSFSDYIVEKLRPLRPYGRTGLKKSALTEASFAEGIKGMHYYSKTQYQREQLAHGTLPYPSQYHELDIRPLFGKLKQLQTRLGKPLYLEWVITTQNSRPQFWVTQIAEVQKRADSFHLSVPERPDFTGHTVYGSGSRVCQKIVVVWNKEDISSLHAFNQKNTNYILLYSSRLVSDGVAGAQMTYADYSNARVFLEYQDAPHAIDPAAHLQGLLESTDKFFAVLDYDAATPPNWGLIDKDGHTEYGLPVGVGEFTILASEKENELYIVKGKI